ncbi:MAG TPA: PTS system mannose/fructose/sorbose family transporter subunit IID [Thermoanaerobacterales bacterium]|nr:PTS system mannose/fructose/sorbose family transporter subunit IID [Thermoanaerobacterales bacterium]
MTDSKAEKKITRKDIIRVFWRTILGLQMGWNYEKMQGLGYCFAILPILKKLYRTKEEMIKALKLHLQFFNTTPAMAHLIVGADIAMEEAYGISNEDTISGIKTGLMGPFAGIGDTVFVAIYRTIVFSLGSYMALEGNVIGALWPIIPAILIWWVRYEFTVIGYEQGRKIAVGFANQLKQLTEGAAILGLTVIGGLAPAVVKANVPLVFKTGDVELKVQDMLDKIMPSLVPIAIVLLSYWLLGRKGFNSTRLILFLVCLGVVLYNLKILG